MRFRKSEIILCDIIEEEPECMLMSREQNAEANLNINIGKTSFRRVASLEYLGVSLKYLNSFLFHFLAKVAFISKVFT